jgi:hypothetical protein
MEQLQSHILLTASFYMGKYFRIYVLGSPSLHMTLQLLHSEFPHSYVENLIFFFISVEDRLRLRRKDGRCIERKNYGVMYNKVNIMYTYIRTCSQKVPGN